MAETVKPRLRVRYEQEIIPALEKEFGYKNVNQVPKMEKIVLNMGLGDVKDNAKGLEAAVRDLETLSLIHIYQKGLCAAHPRQQDHRILRGYGAVTAKNLGGNGYGYHQI